MEKTMFIDDIKTLPEEHKLCPKIKLQQSDSMSLEEVLTLFDDEFNFEIKMPIKKDTFKPDKKNNPLF